MSEVKIEEKLENGIRALEKIYKGCSRSERIEMLKDWSWNKSNEKQVKRGESTRE